MLRRLTLAPLLAAVSCAVLAQNETAAPQVGPVKHVDALNKVFGQHPGARAIHAKGIVLEGSFSPAPGAASISKAAHFQHASVPVTVRFSNFAGIPDIPDNHPLANPRGLAIKFKLPDGTVTDIVAHSFNGFPAPDADEFHQLIVALGASGPGAAKPTALDTYLGSHPVAKNFLTTQKTAPASYATLPYYGVNTFKFTNASGQVAYGRYQFLPVSGEHLLKPADAEKAAPDYLSSEIRQRVKQAPVQFKLQLQIAEPGDKLDDPSIAWPDNRRTVELGTLSVNTVVDNSPAAEKALLFQPNVLTPGIDVQDPMVNVRSAAYAVSFGRRQQ
ncbi:catalase family peroxidase [Pseudomonas gingeri]|nr:catalase family peroxidase [Pseudomonas gingeri]NWA16182.1 catalase family peroxidase [Pseudomonas gingeri]NWA54372.1 catalase family peroxidase [Pseudomonas gingeri]NWA97551.1 catalase family peroxidase [Pseudomonas gingeri]NWB04357.1 catalase family peroxidase [Pseudomonas gingeri]